MNLLITSATARPLLQLLVVVALAVMMPTLIYGHGHHGSGKKHAIALTELANGAHLVMETQSGHVHVRPAREAKPGEPNPAAGSALPGATATNKRVKNNNKKSNKAQNQMQHGSAAGAGAATPGATRKSGYKKSSVVHNEEQPLGHHNGKQQRQLGKHQQHQQQQQQQQEHQQRPGKRSGSKKATEKGPTCRYSKSNWSECDAKTNMRTRTLLLKKGESNCLPTRTMQKACKKACRYERGPWSECTAGQLTREDKLKPADDGSPQPNCNAVRVVNKKCKSPGAGGAMRGNKERKHKDKGARRASPQA